MISQSVKQSYWAAHNKFLNPMVKSTPQFQGRFITPEKSEWLKRYPKTGEAAYADWLSFCKEHQQEMEALPDSFTLTYQLGHLPNVYYPYRYDGLFCQFLSHNNELVEWGITVQRIDYHNWIGVKEAKVVQMPYYPYQSTPFKKYFEEQWGVLKKLFQVINRPLFYEAAPNLQNDAAPTIDDLFWISPAMVTERRGKDSCNKSSYPEYNARYFLNEGENHIKRYELYKKLAVKHQQKLKKLPFGFRLECQPEFHQAKIEKDGFTRLYLSNDYADATSLIRQTYPGGPVQRWGVSTLWLAGGTDSEETIEQFFLASLDKALLLSQRLSLKPVHGESKDC
jgi:hypothetical protein